MLAARDRAWSAPTALVPGAGPISAFLARSRRRLVAQRHLMGTVLGVLAARIAFLEQK